MPNLKPAKGVKRRRVRVAFIARGGDRLARVMGLRVEDLDTLLVEWRVVR
jgi:hypothetical protein